MKTATTNEAGQTKAQRTAAAWARYLTEHHNPAVLFAELAPLRRRAS